MFTMLSFLCVKKSSSADQLYHNIFTPQPISARGVLSLPASGGWAAPILSGLVLGPYTWDFSEILWVASFQPVDVPFEGFEVM